MKLLFILLSLCSLLLDQGVFSAETDEVKQVMEGDSVTLNTGATKQEHDKMLWYFNDTRIALISGHPSLSCLYDGEDGRFRDRLKVDYETGSLTITNIRSEHAGRYEAVLIRSKSSGTSTSLNRNRKCDSTKIIRKISSSHDDIIKTFSVSVTVADKTNKAFEMAPKEQETDMNPGSGLSSGAVAGIVIGLLVCVAAAVAGVIYYRCRMSPRNESNEPAAATGPAVSQPLTPASPGSAPALQHEEEDTDSIQMVLDVLEEAEKSFGD